VDTLLASSLVDVGHRYVSIVAWPRIMPGSVHSLGSAGHSSRAASELAETAAAASYVLAFDMIEVRQSGLGSL
jgi:hypothetical protein